MNIKDMVKGNKTVKFKFYRKEELFYETECGFLFPVPISDTGDGQFNDVDKAMYFMRYIRKHINEIEKEEKRVQEERMKEIEDKENAENNQNSA
jgi:hypothetical protein